MCALARMTGFKKSRFSSVLRMVIISRGCWFLQLCTSAQGLLGSCVDSWSIVKSLAFWQIAAWIHSFMCLLLRLVPCVNNINIVVNLEVFHCSRKSNHLTCMIDEHAPDIRTDCRTTEITIFREIIFPLVKKKRGMFLLEGLIHTADTWFYDVFNLVPSLCMICDFINDWEKLTISPQILSALITTSNL